MAEMSVRRCRGRVVKPAEETPRAVLQLSPIDSLPQLRCYARTLHVYKEGPIPKRRGGAAGVVSEALSKALVHYYPLAGRLRTKDSSPGELQLECCAQGAWFVEAFADSALRDIQYLDLDETSSVALVPQLLPAPDFQDADDEPLVQMQVTQFSCGGFVIGLVMSHTVCDGLGAAQFLNAVGEMARGLPRPTVSPVWHRDFFPFHTNVTAPPPPLPAFDADAGRLCHISIDITRDCIDRLKREFHDVTGRVCSAFDIVAAAFWSLRTRAILESNHFQPNQTVKLVFFANCRHLLHPPLPAGFYGNCFFPVTVAASAETLAHASSVDVVKLIQDAKATLPADFARYLQGGSTDDPFAPPLHYSTLFVSEWARLGFNRVDYGWGPPHHMVPIQGSTIIPVGILASQPSPDTGIRLMSWCVREPHLHPFHRRMTQLLH